MSQKSAGAPARVPAEKLARDIRRAARKHHSAEDKIRIVLEGLRGEESISARRRLEAQPRRPRFVKFPGREVHSEQNTRRVVNGPRGRRLWPADCWPLCYAFCS